jgi:hypothetical protein
VDFYQKVKPILLIILVVAACHNSREYNAPTKESYKIEVSTTPDFIYTVTGHLNGSFVYEKITPLASDTNNMKEEALLIISYYFDTEKQDYYTATEGYTN